VATSRLSVLIRAAIRDRRKEHAKHYDALAKGDHMVP